MSLKVEKLEHSMAKLTIEVDAAEFEKAVTKAYNKSKNKISVPGFRKGKVPQKMIEKMYGAEIFFEDAANIMMEDSYPAAYDECEYEIQSAPEVDVVQMERGKNFIYTATVAIKPEVTLGEYKGIVYDKLEAKASKAEIDAEIEKVRKQNSRMVPVERAAENGDTVTFDFEGFVDGKAFDGGKAENYDLVLGSGSFIPGFEDQLVGVEAEKEVDVNVTFPEDYQAKELAGKAAVFKCTIHEIKKEELPEVDDEFASEVSDFETLKEYKADLKKNIIAKKEADNKKTEEDQVVDQVVEAAQMEIADPMLDNYAKQTAGDFERMLMQQGLDMKNYLAIVGQTPEQFMEQVKPQALKKLRTNLTLEAVAKAEGIEASEEDVEAEIAKMAETYSMEVDKLKEMIGEEEKESMKKDIAVNKAVEFLMANAKAAPKEPKKTAKKAAEEAPAEKTEAE